MGNLLGQLKNRIHDDSNAQVDDEHVGEDHVHHEEGGKHPLAVVPDWPQMKSCKFFALNPEVTRDESLACSPTDSEPVTNKAC